MVEQLANQPADGGSNPTPPLQIREIEHKMAKPFIEHWHYSKKAPTGKNVYFGWFRGEVLYAVADYGIGVNQVQESYLCRLTGLPITKGSAEKGTKQNLYELKRLCRVEPRQESMPLTRFLSICHKMLKRTHGIRFIVSFSDPKFNAFDIKRNGIPYESGGIYRAANFRYLGKTNKEWHVMDREGVIRHRRFAYRHMKRQNKTKKVGEVPMTLSDARQFFGLTRVCTVAKDRWFLDLGQ